MTENQHALANLFAACWKDEALKQRFMSDPKAVLADHGIEIPDDIAVKGVENTDDQVHITLPAMPADAGSLADHELAAAAGGSYQANCTGVPGCTKILVCRQRAE